MINAILLWSFVILCTIISRMMVYISEIKKKHEESKEEVYRETTDGINTRIQNLYYDKLDTLDYANSFYKNKGFAFDRNNVPLNQLREMANAYWLLKRMIKNNFNEESINFAKESISKDGKINNPLSFIKEEENV